MLAALDSWQRTSALRSKGNAMVLIRGETGTGKELIARATHSGTSQRLAVGDGQLRRTARVPRPERIVVAAAPGHLPARLLQPDVAFDVESIAIAQALAISGDMPLAESYFKKAIDKSSSPYYKLVNLAMYANFLFEQARPGEGRQAYRDSLAILDDRTDFNKWANGLTYQGWFAAEVFNLRRRTQQQRLVTRRPTVCFDRSTMQAGETAIQALEALRAESPLSPPP